MGPTLPMWFWIIFYSFFLGIILISIYNLFKGVVKRNLTIANLLLVPLIIIISVIYPIQRVGLNEIQFFFQQLLSLDIIAIFLLGAYSYFVFYIVLFIKNIRSKKITTK